MLKEEGFEKFWSEYPKKRSKGDAFKAWCVLVNKRPETEVILKALAVMKHSEDWRKDGGQFIPYAGTWLRAWGWEDVPDIDLKQVLPDGRMWWESVSGVDEKAKELGIDEGQFQSRMEFRAAVFKAAGVTPMKKTA